MVNIKYNPALLQFQDSIDPFMCRWYSRSTRCEPNPPKASRRQRQDHLSARLRMARPHFALESSEAHWILGFYQQSILGGSSHLVSGL